MTMITITINGRDQRARLLPTDEDWRDAANRVIHTCCGRGASAWNWFSELQGSKTIYTTTIVGRPDWGGHYPILGTATYTEESTNEPQ